MVFHRLIVAFDGSPRAADALALALRLRDPDDGVITLACVVPGSYWHIGPQTHQPDALVPEEIERMFSEARADAIPAGIRVRRRAPVAPSPARGLTELAEQEDADLVVIGSSRHGDEGRIRLDRTAGRLLQGAPCAVAIPPGGLRDDEPFHHIGVAYDGSPEAEAALATAYDIAARSGAAVTLLWALPAADGPEPLTLQARLHAQEALDAAADGAPAGVNPQTKLLYGPPNVVIAGACDGMADLLVAGSRGYGPMQRALLGSVSEQLTDGAPHPVIVLPRQPAPAAAA